MRGQGRFSAVLLGIVLVASVSPISSVLASNGVPTEDRVRVSVRLNTWYDDSATSLKQIKKFIDFFPWEQDSVYPDKDVNHFIIRRYRFGPTELPRTYALIRDAILSANHLASDDQRITVKLIQTPPLPRRARPIPNPSNPYNAFPQVASYAALSLEPSNLLFRAARVEKGFREGSRSTIVTFDLPRSYIQARSNTDQFRSANFKVSAPVKLLIRPAACGGTTKAVPFPDSATRNAILSLFKLPLKRPSYLFIIDSGWPTAEAYNDTLALVEPTLAALRAQSGLQAYKRLHQASFQPLDPQRSSTHVLSVAQAIDGLRNLDTQRRVSVIYVPLDLDQGDDDFFRDLLQTYYAYSWTHSLDSKTPSGQQLEQPVLEKAADDYADTVIQKIRLLAAPGEFYTDNGILEAVDMVAEAVASRQNTTYFINESWTIDSGLLKFSPIILARGISVIACGNDGQDFVQKRIDFAQQCLTSDYFLAVMNISPDGSAQCHSSLIDDSRAGDLRVLGFDGNIGNDSGTSFASPRVAWLLAAKETTLALAAPAYWATDTINAIKAARHAALPKWNDVWFDVPEYFFKNH